MMIFTGDDQNSQKCNWKNGEHWAQRQRGWAEESAMKS